MNGVSLTSLMTAYLRLYHSHYDHPKIFNDDLAAQILSSERQKLIEGGLIHSLKLSDPHKFAFLGNDADKLAYVLQTMPGPPNVLSRARYTENLLAKAIEAGCTQYIILGAGMDTFAYRHPELNDRLQIFELDHPATQLFKRERIAEIHWPALSNLHFVPVDFTKDSLKSSLVNTGYDPDAGSFFSWLGVTMYLPLADILSTFRGIADIASPGSIVVFDYIDSDSFLSIKASPRIQTMMQMARHAGEPILTGFNPAELGEKFEQLGYRLTENLSPADIQQLYFNNRTDGYYACEHVHFACLEVK